MPSQLVAGHAANFEFWTDEVAHCLSVIDSYEERFQRMLAAQQAADQAEPLNDPRPGAPFIPPRIVPRPGRVPEPLRHYVRSELCRAFHSFAKTSYHNGHIAAEVAHAACQRLSIELNENEVPRVP